MGSQQWGSVGHRDSGAVAIETALVSMLLITLIFGIVESGFLFKDMLSVSAAARAGARMGASEPRFATFAQDSADQVTSALSDLRPANIQSMWVYRTTGATGPPPGACNSASSCVPFTWDGTKLATTFTSNWAANVQNACIGDAGHDSVGVYLKYRHSSPLGFFFNNMSLGESTVMFLEPISSSVSCK